MKLPRLLALIAAMTLVIAGAAPAARAGAQPASPMSRGMDAKPVDSTLPKELEGIGIEERPGAELPRDVRLRDQDGREVSIADYLGYGKPVVLVLAYYQCPMLCSMVLNGVVKAMKETPWTAGKEYRVVVVSFDPRDQADVAQKKRAAYLTVYDREVGERGFDFLVGDEASVRRLADAVGFGYRWDAETEQYAHAAGAFVATSDGRLSRTLYGISFPESTLRLALVEASQGAIGTTLDRAILFCFHYDPSAGGYVVATWRLMRAGSALTALLLGVLLLRFFRSERARTREAT
ncbi:MAG TPA: SCO family protein [Candidatus Nanopelagicales bacterium]|nr:SCO family protein [Candidatus Nanopelagicales bacterium]